MDKGSSSKEDIIQTAFVFVVIIFFIGYFLGVMSGCTSMNKSRTCQEIDKTKTIQNMMQYGNPYKDITMCDTVRIDTVSYAQTNKQKRR